MLESSIQPKVIKAFKKAGAYVIRNVICSENGKHDLTICYKGHFISCEVKNETYQPSPLQLLNGRRVKKAGGLSFIVRSVQDVKDILNSITKVI